MLVGESGDCELIKMKQFCSVRKIQSELERALRLLDSPDNQRSFSVRSHLNQVQEEVNFLQRLCGSTVVSSKQSATTSQAKNITAVDVSFAPPLSDLSQLTAQTILDQMFLLKQLDETHKQDLMVKKTSSQIEREIENINNELSKYRHVLNVRCSLLQKLVQLSCSRKKMVQRKTTLLKAIGYIASCRKRNEEPREGLVRSIIADEDGDEFDFRVKLTADRSEEQTDGKTEERTKEKAKERTEERIEKKREEKSKEKTEDVEDSKLKQETDKLCLESKTMVDASAQTEALEIGSDRQLDRKSQKDETSDDKRLENESNKTSSKKEADCLKKLKNLRQSMLSDLKSEEEVVRKEKVAKYNGEDKDVLAAGKGDSNDKRRLKSTIVYEFKPKRRSKKKKKHEKRREKKKCDYKKSSEKSKPTKYKEVLPKKVEKKKLKSLKESDKLKNSKQINKEEKTKCTKLNQIKKSEKDLQREVKEEVVEKQKSPKKVENKTLKSLKESEELTNGKHINNEERAKCTKPNERKKVEKVLQREDEAVVEKQKSPQIPIKSTRIIYSDFETNDYKDNKFEIVDKNDPIVDKMERQNESHLFAKIALKPFLNTRKLNRNVVRNDDSKRRIVLFNSKNQSDIILPTKTRREVSLTWRKRINQSSEVASATNSKKIKLDRSKIFHRS